MSDLGLVREPKRNAQEYLVHWLCILWADPRALMVAAAEPILILGTDCTDANGKSG